MSTASILWLTCCTLGATLVRLTSSAWVRHGEKVPPAIKARMRIASLINAAFWVGSSYVFQGEHWVRLLQMRRPQAAARHSSAAVEMSDSLNA